MDATLLDDTETDWIRPPFARSPVPLTDPVAPMPTDDEFALIRPIVDNDLGVVVESMSAAGKSELAISTQLFQDHGVRVAPHAVGRYVLHAKIVRRMYKLGNTPVHPELDAAIRARHDDLAREAPEDLVRIDRAIDFLDQVVRGNPSALGLAREDIVLRERVKASDKVVTAIKTKYEITKRPIDPNSSEQEVDILEILQGTYGPAVQLQEAARGDPLGILGPKRKP